jgi:uncharacterized protein (DUF2235 family)
MGKNIVIFSDGTGQEGGNGKNSNVYKLFNMVEDRTEKQIAFYDRGLGSGWRKLTGSAFGVGISQNIMECYEFLMNNFYSGDKIYLFGFSRGATTIRSLSGFIHLFGILPKSRPELIKRAYKIYTIKCEEKRERLAGEFVKRHHTMWTIVEFLGVWDTVSALGIPFKRIDIFVNKIPFFKHAFHNLKLCESVLNARHALAIDDERLTFHPQIWDKELTNKKEIQTMKQVWFSGMHTDVGGGYEEHKLSDIPLLWMINEAESVGLKIYPDHKVKITPDASGTMHNSRGTTVTQHYRKKERFWDSEKYGKPVIHYSVLERKRNEKNTDSPPYNPWILRMDYEVESKY